MVVVVVWLTLEEAAAIEQEHRQMTTAVGWDVEGG